MHPTHTRFGGDTDTHPQQPAPGTQAVTHIPPPGAGAEPLIHLPQPCEGQAVVIMCRAQPDKHTDQSCFTFDWRPLYPFLLTPLFVPPCTPSLCPPGVCTALPIPYSPSRCKVQVDLPGRCACGFLEVMAVVS